MEEGKLIMSSKMMGFFFATLYTSNEEVLFIVNFIIFFEHLTVHSVFTFKTVFGQMEDLAFWAFCNGKSL